MIRPRLSSTIDRFLAGTFFGPFMVCLAAFTAALTVPTRPAGRAVAMAFAALVAWARVRVGHHRTIDVLAGAGVGTLAGSVLAAVLPSGTP